MTDNTHFLSAARDQIEMALRCSSPESREHHLKNGLRFIDLSLGISDEELTERSPDYNRGHVDGWCAHSQHIAQTKGDSHA